MFSDAEGKRWRVFDWRVIAGRRSECLPGERAGELRGFLSLETGERRVFEFSNDAESRALVVELLDRQLARANRIGDTPEPLAVNRRAWRGSTR